MTTFTIAMTVLMVMIGLGQLVISIAMLSSSKRTAIKNWALLKFDGLMLFLMVALGVAGLIKFALTKDPEKWDYYLMAGSFGVLSMAYAVFLCILMARRMWEIQQHVMAVEDYLGYSSEPSDEDPDG